MKKYKIIYADPPWSYRKSKGRGVAQNHYQTMKDQDLRNFDFKSIVDDDCALICWVVFPKISECISIIEGWGFEIKTLFASWIKTNPRQHLKQKSFLPTDFIDRFTGLGYYTRQNCEVCLLATKGNMYQYVKRKDISSVVIEPIEGHSKKPDKVRQMIVDLFGDLPRIELFAREKAKGWDVFGNEVKESIKLEG